MKPSLLHLHTDPLDARALRWAHEAGLHVIGLSSQAERPRHLHMDEFHPIDSEDIKSLERFLDTSQTLESSRLAGFYSSKQSMWSSFCTLAGRLGLGLELPRPGVLAHAQDLSGCHEQLRAVALRTDADGPLSSRKLFGLSAFFRDGDFVRGGITERREIEAEHATFFCQGHLAEELEDELYDAFENAVRALDLDQGPVHGALALDELGISLVQLDAGFGCAMASSYITPLSLGKSPLQAWFASLAQAGGPFDAMPHRPLRCAGWIGFRAAAFEPHDELLGLDRARSSAGIEGVRAGSHVPAESSPGPFAVVVWGTGEDSLNLRARLLTAKGRIRPAQGIQSAA